MSLKTYFFIHLALAVLIFALTADADAQMKVMAGLQGWALFNLFK